IPLRSADDRRRAVEGAGEKPAPLAGEAEIRARVLALADQQRVLIESLSLSAHEAAIVINNVRYRRETEAIGRLTRILMAATPPEIERFRFISLENGLPTREIVLERSAIERTVMARGDAREILATSDIRPASPAEPLLSLPPVASYPRFGWALAPQFRESLFDPSQPFRYEIFAAVSGNVEIQRGLNLDGTFELDIYDTFGNLRPSNSELPHVRSDANLYFKEGADGIDHLRLTYVRTLAPGFYGLVRGGYLESMFAGFGGEVLWRPEGKRWALGLAVYEAWQRDFDRLFGLMSYNVVVGHASLYYESPYYGLNFNLHAGRYLAGDYGVTFEMTRRFETGVEIGAFVTFTNVPFSKFGEGSFDKGIIIRIPLESVLPVHSQTEAKLDFTSLTRDGGQRLGDEQSLYGLTRRTSYGEILGGWHAVTAP
ncbi:MAG TPA: YjbH domain-containing protein, partial [Micropepsaceae bacterium]|nr:YjbH domain-containing protein [Micropepsaceae bacterium]